MKNSRVGVDLAKNVFKSMEPMTRIDEPADGEDE
jgi:hypothetical protein